MKVLNFNEYQEIADILNDDGIVAFPTETVFGLGVIASNDNYKRLVKVKERTPGKPFTLMFSKLEQVMPYIELDNLSLNIIKDFFPGPLTLIVKAKNNVPDFVDLKSGFVGIRMPNNKDLLNIINIINRPLLVPSCNKSGDTPCKNDEDVYDIFKDEIDAVVIGNCNNNIASTIIKVNNNELELIRQGIIKLSDIKEKIYENSNSI